MNIKPTRGKIVVRGAEWQLKTPGGIYLPEKEKKRKVFRGTVLAVGDDCTEGLEVGQDIFFGRYVSTLVVVDGIEYLILPEKEVLGVLEE